MATEKPFEARAASVIDDPRARLADFPRLIGEGHELAEQLRGTLAQANADAVDFKLSEDDRTMAARLAEQSRLRLATVTGAIEALTAHHAERKAASKVKAIEAEKAAAIADRDHLAERFRKFGPPMFAELVEILGLIEANAKRLKRAGLRDSLTAEHLARGLGHFVGHSPVQLFAQMKIPAWAGAGRAWPHSDFVNPAAVGVYDPKAVERQRAANVEKHRSRWGRYRLEKGTAKGSIAFTEKKPQPMGGKKRVFHASHYDEFGPQECDLDHAEAERLRGLGVGVKPLADRVSDEDLLFY